MISEVQYNPSGPSAAALAIDPMLDSNDLEFTEIHNATGRTVDLTEWRIRGGVDLDFDDGTTIGSLDTWIVLSFNPDNPDNASRLSAFVTHYGLTGAETFVGGYGGSLSNSQDRVQLQWPDEKPNNGPDVIPRLFQDEITYDDRAPWPTTADGNGPSLQRLAPVFYGNDVTSWRAVAPTPGQVDFSGNVVGDYNNDGLINAEDIDILATAAIKPSAAVYMDLDGSLSVTQGDVTTYLRTIVGSRFGDANLDGVVDGSDFNIWNDNKFQSCNKSWSEGDWNGDAVVDGSDFNIWTINKFQSAVPLAAEQAAPSARIPRAAASTDVTGIVPSTPDSNVAIRSILTDEVAPLTCEAVDQVFGELSVESSSRRMHARNFARRGAVVQAQSDDVVDGRFEEKFNSWLSAAEWEVDFLA